MDGIAFDAAGKLWASDGTLGFIQQLDPSHGNVLSSFASSATAIAFQIPVPEPTTAGLLTGSGMVLLLRRRRA